MDNHTMKRLLLLLGLLALPCFGQVLNLKSDSATFGSASATTKLDNQGNYNQTNNTTGAWILLGTNAALTFIGISNFQNNITPFTSFGLFNYNGAQGTNGLTLGSFPTSAQLTTASANVPILYFMP